jgi:hypothetical protein
VKARGSRNVVGVFLSVQAVERRTAVSIGGSCQAICSAQSQAANWTTSPLCVSFDQWTRPCSWFHPHERNLSRRAWSTRSQVLAICLAFSSLEAVHIVLALRLYKCVHYSVNWNIDLLINYSDWSSSYFFSISSDECWTNYWLLRNPYLLTILVQDTGTKLSRNAEKGHSLAWGSDMEENYSP